MNDLHHVFVYGTLKQGQCREKCWPLEPLSVVAAWTLGRLYDLGPYPAMVRGDTPVAGQLWSYNGQAIEKVRLELDCIEVTNQPGIPNEYDRVEVQVHTLDGTTLMAETYLFSRPDQLVRFAKLHSAELDYGELKLAVWPKNCPWP